MDTPLGVAWYSPGWSEAASFDLLGQNGDDRWIGEVQVDPNMLMYW